MVHIGDGTFDEVDKKRRLAQAIGARFGMTAAFEVLATVTPIGFVNAWKMRPVYEPDAIAYSHADTAAFAAHLEQHDE